MSGALETAAGALAVIGAADVAIRTGREVYGFLCSLSDAPKEINRLCDLIKDTTLMAETSKQCLDKLKDTKPPVITHGAVTSLEVSLKGFNREVQSLRVLISRFKGTTKTWNRVRYVLDERKTGKALENLERSNVLLGNALIMACRKLSAIDHLNTQSLIRLCYKQHGLRVNSVARTLSSTLEDHRRSLNSTLKEHHQQALQNHETHREGFSSVHRSHAKILSRQACLARTSTRIYKETARVSRTLTKTQRTMTEEHHKTRDILSAKIEELSKPLVQRRLTPISSRTRDIHFFGERRDMIMAYLLLVKAQIEVLIRNVISHADGETSMRHIAWLQFEFERLVASAAQEEAATHLESTSTSLDRWFYSEDIVYSLTTAKRRSSKCLPDKTSRPSVKEKAYTHLQAPRRLEPTIGTQQTFSQDTPFGHLRVHVPRKLNTSKDTPAINEVGFSFTCGIGQSVHAISARFFRDNSDGPSPQLCTQLNVFTVAESDDHYDDLFANGTIEEIDAALRQGIISPYHINQEGRNMCLYFAAEHTRTDLFDYLDSQGIGVSALNHDFSIVAGLFKRSVADKDRHKLEASTDHVLDKVYDSSSFLFETTINMLLWDYYKARPRSLLKVHLHRLEKEKLIQNHTLLTSSQIMDDSPWDWESVSCLIYPLFETCEYINSTGSLGRNRIQRCFSVLMWENSPGNSKAAEDIAAMLIGAGVNIHHRDNNGLTPSMYARRDRYWDEWVNALVRNGMCIEDVAREDKSEWILEETWQETWRLKYDRL